jgi:TolA protein
LKHAELKRELNLERKYQKEKEAEEKAEAAAARRVAHIDAEGIAAGVTGGSTANKTGGAGGRALSREEGRELDAYFQLLKNRIKENPPPEGMADSLSAKVEFFVAADGSISQVRIIHSSGNPEFDRFVIEACEHTRSIGPRPDGKSDSVRIVYSLREDESS